MVIIGKRRIRLRFFVLLALLIISFMYVIRLKNETKIAFVQWGELGTSQKMDAIIIRDEKIIESDEYGKIIYTVPEGEKVNKGTKIAELYKLGYDEKVIDERNLLQQKIKDYQENNILQDIVDKDLKSFNNKIIQKAEDIFQAVQNSQCDSIPLQEQQIKSLMEQREKYLQKTIKADDYLNRLYQQEMEMDEKISEWMTEVLAVDSGIVSFSFDGCEVLLSPDNLDKLKPMDFENILRNSVVQEAEQAKVSRPLYKLINGYKWYVVIIDRNKEQALQSNQRYELNFEGYEKDTFQGKVIQIKPYKKDTYYVLEMMQDIGPLINIRKGKAAIGSTYEGLKVPIKAITHQGQENGVVCRERGEEKFVPIQVIARDNRYAIIKPKTDSTTIKVNAQVLVQ